MSLSSNLLKLEEFRNRQKPVNQNHPDPSSNHPFKNPHSQRDPKTFKPLKKSNPGEFLRDSIDQLTPSYKKLNPILIQDILNHFLTTFESQELCDWLIQQGRFMLDLDLTLEARPYFILLDALFAQEGQESLTRIPFIQVIGDIALQQNHFSEAIFCYKKALALQPGHLEIREKLSYTYGQLGAGFLEEKFSSPSQI